MTGLDKRATMVLSAGERRSQGTRLANKMVVKPHGMRVVSSFLKEEKTVSIVARNLSSGGQRTL